MFYLTKLSVSAGSLLYYTLMAVVVHRLTGISFIFGLYLIDTVKSDRKQREGKGPRVGFEPGPVAHSSQRAKPAPKMMTLFYKVLLNQF